MHYVRIDFLSLLCRKTPMRHGLRTFLVLGASLTVLCASLTSACGGQSSTTLGDQRQPQ